MSDGERLPDEDRNMEPNQLALPQQNRFCDSKLPDEQSEVTFMSIIVTHASHEDQLCDTEINCSQGVVTKDSASGSQSDRIYTGTNKNYSYSDEDNDSKLEEEGDEQLSDDPEKWLDPHKYGNKKV